jgi:hypothetical protein
VYIVVSVYFVIDSVRKLLDTPSLYFCHHRAPYADEEGNGERKEVEKRGI